MNEWLREEEGRREGDGFMTSWKEGEREGGEYPSSKGCGWGMRSIDGWKDGGEEGPSAGPASLCCDKDLPSYGILEALSSEMMKRD